MNIESLSKKILAGDRVSLARAITLIESTKPDDRKAAIALLEQLHPHTGKAIRVGISGVPGVGKSTLIEKLGLKLVDDGKKLAVLAIDPSSTLTGGSILGDKTRMQSLSQKEAAFIRPSPSTGALGGVGHHTREAILLCEAAGFDTLLIETVGVGQSEVAVGEMVDFFLLMLLPGGGDELQGIKRGILELADMVVVNKAEKDNLTKSRIAQQQYQSALHILRDPESNWKPPVLLCSALHNKGIEEIWQTVLEHRKQGEADGSVHKRRKQQNISWMWANIHQLLIARLKARPEMAKQCRDFEKQVAEGNLLAPQAADQIVEAFAPSSKT